MIEVRIRPADLIEYSNSDSVSTYVYQKLVAAGIPLKDGVFSRNGTLEGGDYDPSCDCMIWRWYEDGEQSPSRVCVQ